MIVLLKSRSMWRCVKLLKKQRLHSPVRSVSHTSYVIFSIRIHWTKMQSCSKPVKCSNAVHSQTNRAVRHYVSNLKTTVTVICTPVRKRDEWISVISIQQKPFVTAHNWQNWKKKKYSSHTTAMKFIRENELV